jgi:hypothetical protein
MSTSTRIFDTPVSHVRPRQWQCKKEGVADVNYRLRVVTEFRTAKGFSPTEIDRRRRNVCEEDSIDISSVRR